MSDDSGSDQGERRGAGELVPAAPEWDALFVPAEPDPAESPPPPPRASSTPRIWLKAATPLLVVAIYIGIKLFPDPGSSGTWNTWRLPKAPTTLTGVAPVNAERVSVDRATGAFLAELEARAARNEWAAIKQSIADQPDAAVREHPVVVAFAMLGRSRTGERNIGLEAELARAEQSLQGSGARYAGLVDELKLARAEQILSRSGDPEILSLSIDTLYALLGSEATTPRNLDVRLRAARLFEAFGDDIAEKAKGYLQTDVVRLRQARAHYQMALRFLVKSDRWLDLQPVSPRATSPIEGIVEKIRIANRAIHGPSLPFTRYDSTTWTGEKGSPVHDIGAARR